MGTENSSFGGRRIAVIGSGAVVAQATNPIYQERLHVGLHRLEHRVLLHDFVPRIQFQQRFCRAGGAGIKGDDPARGVLGKKNAMLIGIKGCPTVRRQPKIGEETAAAGHPAVFLFGPLVEKRREHASQRR